MEHKSFHNLKSIFLCWPWNWLPLICHRQGINAPCIPVRLYGCMCQGHCFCIALLLASIRTHNSPQMFFFFSSASFTMILISYACYWDTKQTVVHWFVYVLVSSVDYNSSMADVTSMSSGTYYHRHWPLTYSSYTTIITTNRINR